MEKAMRWARFLSVIWGRDKLARRGRTNGRPVGTLAGRAPCPLLGSRCFPLLLVRSLARSQFSSQFRPAPGRAGWATGSRSKSTRERASERGSKARVEQKAWRSFAPTLRFQPNGAKPADHSAPLVASISD